MIFVTVGTHYLGFERLIKKVDEIAGKIDEEVIAQIGSTDYKPKNMAYFTFVEEEKMSELYKKSRIIVTHSGAGTFLRILNYNKPIVVIPRFKKFNEHIDDHQLELAEIFNNKGKAIAVYDIKNLENALEKTKKIICNKNIKNKRLITFLKDYIGKMENENMHGSIDSISS